MQTTDIPLGAAFRALREDYAHRNETTRPGGVHSACGFSYSPSVAVELASAVTCPFCLRQQEATWADALVLLF